MTDIATWGLLALAAYAGASGWPIWTIPIIGVGNLVVYYFMRSTTVISDIQTMGAPKAIAFLFLTNTLTAGVIYGVGWFGASLFY